MIDEATLRKALQVPLERTTFEGLGTRYEGKVRDNYSLPNGTRILITTDRISAFDRVLGTLPLKGQVLSRLAVFWFDRTKALVPNHLRAAPDPCVMVAQECTPLPLEVVVRAYLTGVTSTSIWTAYERGERSFCGHSLPEGLRKNDALPAPIVTPSTKGVGAVHDRSVSGAELIAEGLLSSQEFEAVSSMALTLFSEGSRHCAARGLLLADTKYEFGRTPDGSIVVMDEMHTPDSSRFWKRDTYQERVARGEEPESLDKEYVRRWLAAQGFRGDGPIPPLTDEVRIEAARRYISAYEWITGEDFTPDLSPPIERIRGALAPYFGAATT